MRAKLPIGNVINRAWNEHGEALRVCKLVRPLTYKSEREKKLGNEYDKKFVNTNKFNSKVSKFTN